MRERRSARVVCVAGVILAGGLFAVPSPAQTAAPTAEELQAARDLFQEAFKDEKEKRYPEALEKFRRVAKVKESASVRYRIATVLAAMGRLREARDIYRALAAGKASLPPSDHETADSAAEKAAELDRRIPKLALRVEDDAPPDVRVTLDGAPVPVSTTPRAIDVDPGDHVVSASARGAPPVERKVTLAEGGGEVAHTVSFERTDKGPSATPARDDTLGWVAIAGGAGLVVIGGGLLVAREGVIGEIQDACPLRICPAVRRREIEDDRARADLFAPLGATFVVVGVVAAGLGLYLLARPNVSGRASLSARIGPKTTGIGFSF